MVMRHQQKKTQMSSPTSLANFASEILPRFSFFISRVSLASSSASSACQAARLTRTPRRSSLISSRFCGEMNRAPTGSCECVGTWVYVRRAHVSERDKVPRRKREMFKCVDTGTRVNIYFSLCAGSRTSRHLVSSWYSAMHMPDSFRSSSV